QLRTLGVGRAAERSLSAYTQKDAELIQAYSDGVNAWLDRNSLPPEYAALEITQVPRWRPVDSLTVVKLIQFQLAFDVTDLVNSEALSNFQAAGQVRGFDGTRLFFEDIFTFVPFDPAVTIPRPAGASSFLSQSVRSPGVQSEMVETARQARGQLTPGVMK